MSTPSSTPFILFLKNSPNGEERKSLDSTMMNPFTTVMISSFLCSLKRYRALFRVETCRRSSNPSSENFFHGNLTVLDQGEHWLVVEKTPSVVCHHSDWVGSRSREEIPMLQRTREAFSGRRVNLVHRLDRGCSGCLLMTFANDNDDNEESCTNDEDNFNPTRILNDAMQDSTTVKTYVALVRGEGILHGRDFRREGWFKVDVPISNVRGNIANATTLLRFVAGQDNGCGTIDRPRASIVLARPSTGRWHQIRKHLNSLSHPILGDSSHGNSRVNREFKARYGMLEERTCLHLACIDMEATEAAPDGIHVKCPLAPDMLQMLETNMPDLLEAALPILSEEGVLLKPPIDSRAKVLPYRVALSPSPTTEVTPQLIAGLD